MGLIELTFPNFLKALLLWAHLDQQEFHVEGENRSSAPTTLAFLL